MNKYNRKPKSITALLLNLNTIIYNNIKCLNFLLRFAQTPLGLAHLSYVPSSRKFKIDLLRVCEKYNVLIGQLATVLARAAL